MKSVKITKMLTNPEVLLRKAGAVHGKQAFPSQIYMNDKDHNELRKNLEKAVKKQYPFLVKQKIDTSVGMTFLNLGPVNLKKDIEKGYLLVDNRGIKEKIQKASGE